MSALASCAAESPGSDRELTVRGMHAIADELVRLRLQDPLSYPEHSVVAQAEWMSRARFPPGTMPGAG